MKIIKRLLTEKNISFLAACITLATAIIGVLAVDAEKDVYLVNCKGFMFAEQVFTETLFTVN